MAAPKRTTAQRAQDRADVARWIAEGATVRDMAARLKLSPGQVQYDVARLRREWLAQAGIDTDYVLRLELMRLDMVTAAAWEAYRRSQRPQETKAGSQSEGGSGKKLTRTSVRTVERDGDAAFLNVVAGTVDRRLKILELVQNKDLETRLLALESQLGTGTGGRR